MEAERLRKKIDTQIKIEIERKLLELDRMQAIVEKETKDVKT